MTEEIYDYIEDNFNMDNMTEQQIKCLAEDIADAHFAQVEVNAESLKGER